MKPIPLRLARRPVDGRGYPIPYNQFVGTDGKPDFRILDSDRTLRCIRLRRCSLCGELLGTHVYFVGGPGSCASGMFTQPAMHQGCALFALQTCPHLATAKGRYSPLTNLPDEPGRPVVVNEYVSATKAERFALMHGRRYGWFVKGQGLIIQAELPWIDVRWFQDGEEIAA